MNINRREAIAALLSAPALRLETAGLFCDGNEELLASRLGTAYYNATCVRDLGGGKIVALLDAGDQVLAESYHCGRFKDGQRLWIDRHRHRNCPFIGCRKIYCRQHQPDPRPIFVRGAQCQR